jgi:molecular chaperone GrpE
MKELLATIDNLERALGHARQEEDVDKENLLEGVELTFRSLMRTLEQSGVTVVEAEGQEFDPKVHEAIRQVPSDEHPPGTVVEVYQKGYVMKNRLLRPALVAVVGPDGGDSS